MTKLALFVEGQTEAIFAERLVLAVMGESSVRVDFVKASGPLGSRTLVRIQGAAADTGQPFYALIRDCGGDSTVISDIADEYENLRASGYTMIIGLKDLYPALATQPVVQKAMEHGLRLKLKRNPPEVRLILAVRETEAWFIAEHTHFARLDPRLTPAAILRGVGFDPSVENVEALAKPSDDLKRIYQIVGRTYRKKKADVERTVDRLDYAFLYLDVQKRVPSLARLVACVDEFLS